MVSRAKDMTGLKIGKLTVLKRVENDKNSKAQWLCQCECGRQAVRAGRTIRLGRSRSCGCLKGGGSQSPSPKTLKTREQDRKRYAERKKQADLARNLATMKW